MLIEDVLMKFVIKNNITFTNKSQVNVLPPNTYEEQLNNENIDNILIETYKTNDFINKIFIDDEQYIYHKGCEYCIWDETLNKIYYFVI